MTGKTPPAPIAIDGAAASGKTTLGMALAARLGYAFLDTGLMYRAVTLAALRAGVPAEDGAAGALLAGLDLQVESGAETRVFIGNEDVTGRLRDPDVEQNVSRYSALPSVREGLVRLQREIAARGPSILAGRDIGTVVLPDAPLKIFLEASDDTRAARRSRQAAGWGQRQAGDEARKDIEGRDRVDSSRKVSPLRPADDAVILDTTKLSPGDVVGAVLEHLRCVSA